MIHWLKTLLTATVLAGGLAACGGDGDDHVPVAPATVSMAFAGSPASLTVSTPAPVVAATSARATASSTSSARC